MGNNKQSLTLSRFIQFCLWVLLWRMMGLMPTLVALGAYAFTFNFLQKRYPDKMWTKVVSFITGAVFAVATYIILLYILAQYVVVE